MEIDRTLRKLEAWDALMEGYCLITQWARLLSLELTDSPESRSYQHWAIKRLPDVECELWEIIDEPKLAEFIEQYGKSLSDSMMSLIREGHLDTALESAPDFVEELLSQSQYYVEAMS